MTRTQVRIVVGLALGILGASSGAAQPSKEYIRVNGRVIAIESTAVNTACISAPTALSFRGTGMAAGGGILADGVVDPNWTLVSNPGSYAGSEGSNAIVFTSSYGGSTANSKPINPIGNGGALPAGAYVFRHKLDLSCHNPASVAISGSVQADDNLQIYVNGKFQSAPPANWYSAAAFTISGSGGAFVQGWNQIDFVVTNVGDPGNNPMLMRVDVTAATATVDTGSNGLKFDINTSPIGGTRFGNVNMTLSSGSEQVTWAMEAPIQGSLSGSTSNSTGYNGPGTVGSLTVGTVKATSTSGNPPKVAYFPIWMNPGVGGSVAISGATTNLPPYTSRAFNATVSGVPAGGVTTVRWSIVSVAGSGYGTGVIDTGTNCVNSMNYRAPSTIPINGAIVLKAESCQNPTWSSTVSISVSAGTSVTVTMSPKPASVSGSQSFSAVVSNADTPGVTWSVAPAAAGTITNAGVFTVASGFTGNATVTARSIENTAVTDVHPFSATFSAPAYQSSLVSFVMPSSMTQGGPFTSTVTMQNPAGGVTWETTAGAGSNQVVLASQTPEKIV